MDEYEMWLEAEHKKYREDYMRTVGERKYDMNQYACLQSALEIVVDKYRAFKAKAEEPLAVLADRFRYEIGIGRDYKTRGTPVWAIGLYRMIGRKFVREHMFTGFEYAAAEQAAREHLNKLEDK